MRRYGEEVRRKGETLGFVPTMGALHKGHGELIGRAKRENNRVVVSIFVNPTQFGPSEDYDRYPRTWEEDYAYLNSLGVDAVFAPPVEEVYPVYPPRVFVEVESLTQHFCGKSRPGHFRGVATVVTKLLNILLPHRAYFGEKDYQQWKVVSALVQELLLPVEIVPVPTVREEDGLACSSRNRYLSPQERKEAGKIFQAMVKVQDLFQKGERRAEILRSKLRRELKKIPGVKVDYAEIADPHTLLPIKKGEMGEGRILLAVYLGGTRLIDNLPLTLRKEVV